MLMEVRSGEGEEERKWGRRRATGSYRLFHNQQPILCISWFVLQVRLRDLLLTLLRRDLSSKAIIPCTFRDKPTTSG